jgi:transcriptional regulator of NAD metabolism
MDESVNASNSTIQQKQFHVPQEPSGPIISFSNIQATEDTLDIIILYVKEHNICSLTELKTKLKVDKIIGKCSTLLSFINDESIKNKINRKRKHEYNDICEDISKKCYMCKIIMNKKNIG